MIFRETPIAGCWVIDIERRSDERGFFARSYCNMEFDKAGLVSNFVQCNISFNSRAGTIRGMHYQLAPNGETKLVRCTSGALFDVIVDVRKGSETFGQSFSVELTARNRRMLYISTGIAHGFQCLTDDCEVFYQMAEYFVPSAAAGIYYNDPDLDIHWPMPVTAISSRDLALPKLDEI